MQTNKRVQSLCLSILAAMSCIFTMATSHAEDLGTVGPVYSIAEESMIEAIKNKFKAMQQDGELDQLNHNYQQQVISGLEHPKTLQGISPTTNKPGSWLVDPSLTINKNIVDAKGKILWPAGTTVNPLDYQPMNKVLMFFDASDKKQVTWADNYIKATTLPVKPILVGGEPFALMKKWKKIVYFDQKGYLVKHFEITHVPTIITQDGRYLRVQEIQP